MTKSKYYGDQAAENYFGPSPTTSSSSSGAAPSAGQPAPTTSVIDEAVKSYTQSSHKVTIKRYVVKRG